jgi:type IV secretion system protein VirD4
MLGYKTLRKQHRSTSRGSGTHQVSINHTEEKRALFLPQEIKELPADDELIFYEGCKPIRARKNWYFKDRQLKQRASLPAALIKLAASPRGSAADTGVAPSRSGKVGPALRQ